VALERKHKQLLQDSEFHYAESIESMILFYKQGLITIKWIDGEPKFRYLLDDYLQNNF
jgi:hypothetical protein